MSLLPQIQNNPINSAIHIFPGQRFCGGLFVLHFLPASPLIIFLISLLTFYLQTTTNTYADDMANEFTVTPNPVPTGSVSTLTVAAQLNGHVQLTWTDPAAAEVTDGVTLSTWASTKVVYKAGDYPTSPEDGTLVLNGTLTYTGNELTAIFKNYNTAQLTIGGVVKNTALGTYKATFTPTDDYCWSDGSTTAKEVSFGRLIKPLAV